MAVIGVGNPEPAPIQTLPGPVAGKHDGFVLCNGVTVAGDELVVLEELPAEDGIARLNFPVAPVSLMPAGSPKDELVMVT